MVRRRGVSPRVPGVARPARTRTREASPTPAPPGCSGLLALAVHEFRTPVTVVAGYLRMILRLQAEPLSDRQRKLLGEAERSCERLAELVAQMSDLANVVAGGASLNRADVPIFDLLTDAAASVKEGEDRGVRLEVRGAVPGTLVRGDAARLRAVFTALLHATAREHPGAAVVFADCAVTRERGRRWARVRIGDETSLRTLDAHAAPFDEHRGGIGMALPIARRIVEAHGGRMWSPARQKRAAAGLALPLKR